MEAKLVVQALRINTLSKLTFTDGARFDALVRDVFPGIDFKDIEYDQLAAAYRDICKEKHLLVNENQVGVGEGDGDTPAQYCSGAGGFL